MLAAPISSVFPNMGSHVLIISFVIVVIGGIGSVWGALVAALVIGFADTFGKVLVPELSGWSSIWSWRRCCCGGPKASSRKVEAMKLDTSLVLKLLALAGLACVPLAGADFYTELIAKTLVMAIFAMSLDLLVGFTGLVSFGHAAYFGIAAYAVALLAQVRSRQPVVVLPASVGLAALAALVVGSSCCAPRASTSSWSRWPSPRCSSTSSTTPAGRRLRRPLPQRQADGRDRRLPALRPRPAHPPLLLHPRHAGAGVRLLARVLQSPFGRVLVGIKSNEHRMQSLGYVTFRYKLAAFALAGGLGGVAGFLYAVVFGFVTPELMSWHQSGNVLLMVILGGMGNLGGGGRGLRLRRDAGSVLDVDQALAARHG
jgi:branched-chain amino acid transport system permease protein